MTIIFSCDVTLQNLRIRSQFLKIDLMDTDSYKMITDPEPLCNVPY
jgi:hypothetical protein